MPLRYDHFIPFLPVATYALHQFAIPDNSNVLKPHGDLPIDIEKWQRRPVEVNPIEGINGKLQQLPFLESSGLVVKQKLSIFLFQRSIDVDDSRLDVLVLDNKDLF